jgi:hypothetical protein
LKPLLTLVSEQATIQGLGDFALPYGVIYPGECHATTKFLEG